MTIRRLSVLILSVILLLASLPAAAATRIGLHATTEEKAIWNQRRVSGPYKTAQDVSNNSPGDWTRIQANADALVANQNLDRWDGTWPVRGASGAGRFGSFSTCVQPCGFAVAPGCPATTVGSNRAIGDRPRDAGFVYLVTGNTSYIAPVKNYLLFEAGLANLDWTNTQRWCTGADGNQNSMWDANDFFDLGNYLSKLVFAYDYIRPALLPGGDAPDASAVSVLDAWFLAMGTRMEEVIQVQTRDNFATAARTGLTDPTSFALSSTGTTNSGLGKNFRQYCGGPFTNNFAEKYQNRMVSMATPFALIGVMQNNALFIQKAKRYFMEFFMFGTWPDGTPNEFWRGAADGLSGAQHGWRYAIDTVSKVALWADALGRTGDTSLLDFTTNTGAGTSTDTTAGPPAKGLAKTQLELSKYVDYTNLRWAVNQSTGCTTALDPNYRIGVFRTSGELSNRDHYLANANMYYRDPTVRSEYLRTHTGGAITAPPYPASPEGGGYCVWCGASGILPGPLFMWGSPPGNVIDTQVDPYTLGGGGDTLAPKAPTSFTPTVVSSSRIDLSWVAPTQNTDNSALTDLAGYRITYCTGFGCAPSTDLTPDEGLVLSRQHTGLAPNTLHRYKIRAKDAVPNMSPDSTIIEAATSPAGLIGAWNFDLGTGTTADDGSGFTHTCTFQNNATWGTPGILGAHSLVLDGTDDYCLVTGTAALRPTAQFGITAWIKTAAGDTGGATILNMSDVYGIRVNTDGSLGCFFHDGTFKSVASTGVNLFDNVNHHVMCVKTATALEVYNNNVLVGTSALTGTLSYTVGSGNLNIGRNAAPSSTIDFNGTIDNVCLYDAAIDSTTRAAIFAGTACGSAADTIAPKPPTNVQVTMISASQLNLTWTAPVLNADDSPLGDLAGYKIYRCMNALCSPTVLVDTLVGLNTAYPAVGLDPDTTYGFQVTAYDTATTPNESLKSTPIEYEATDPGVPPPVSVRQDVYRILFPDGPVSVTLGKADVNVAARVASPSTVRMATGLRNPDVTDAPASAHNLWCRENGGAWEQIIDRTCELFNICYSDDAAVQANQVLTASLLPTGGTAYATGRAKRSSIPPDIVVVPAGGQVEYIDVVRVKAGLAAATLIECCQRYDDGDLGVEDVELAQCTPATLFVGTAANIQR